MRVRAHARCRTPTRRSSTCSPRSCASTWPRCRRAERPRRATVVVGGRRCRGPGRGLPAARGRPPRSTSPCSRPSRAVGGKLADRRRSATCELESGRRLVRRPQAVGGGPVPRARARARDSCRRARRGAYLWTERGLVPLPEDAPFGIPGDIGDVLRWPGLSRAGTRAAPLTDLLSRKPRRTGDRRVARRAAAPAARATRRPSWLIGAAPRPGCSPATSTGCSVDATFPELARVGARAGQPDPRVAGRAARERPPRGRRPDVPAAGGRRRRRSPTRAARSARDRRASGSAPRPARSNASAGRFAVRTDRRPVSADAVVLAAPAFVAAELARGLGAARPPTSLAAIPYALDRRRAPGLRARARSRALPEATGFVVPRGKRADDRLHVAQRKWPEDAFGTRAVRPLLRRRRGRRGRARRARRGPRGGRVRGTWPAFLPLPERAEASRSSGGRARCRSTRSGTSSASRGSATALPPGIFVTGSAYDGVGIPDCVRSAGETAERVRAHLADRTAWATPTATDRRRSDRRTCDERDHLRAVPGAARPRDGFRDLDRGRRRRRRSRT